MTSPSLYHVITGGGNPAALHGNVTFCFSFTVTEEEGFAIKCGNSEKKKSIQLSLLTWKDTVRL